MANTRGKAIDNTHLSIDTAERRGFIHRDYIAHCLRWTHVAKYLQEKARYKTAHVLDIGCGVDLPLARLLYSSRLIVQNYVGVDYNNAGKFDLSPFHTGKMPVHAYGNVDAAQHVEMGGEGTGHYEVADEYHTLPTVITCFEVLEHIEPGHCRAMSGLILDLLKKKQTETNHEARAFLSTPCWDPRVGAAGNHVSEILYEAFGAMLEDLGFAIENHWGTFASQRDYKDKFLAQYGDAGREMWDKLSAFYDSNYIATIFAPLYPSLSRNCLWRVKPAPEGYQRIFPPLKEIEGPWTSSDRWADLDNDEAYP